MTSDIYSQTFVSTTVKPISADHKDDIPNPNSVNSKYGFNSLMKKTRNETLI